MADESLYRGTGKRGRGKVKKDGQAGAKVFAKQLGLLMAEMGWTRAEIGRKAGVLRSAVNKWFQAKRLPHGGQVRRLALASGYSADWLLFGKGPTLPDALQALVLDKVLEGVPVRQRSTVAAFLPHGPALVEVAVAHAQAKAEAIRAALKTEDPRDHVRHLLSVASVQDDAVLERRLRAWLKEHADIW